MNSVGYPGDAGPFRKSDVPARKGLFAVIFTSRRDTPALVSLSLSLFLSLGLSQRPCRDRRAEGVAGLLVLPGSRR